MSEPLSETPDWATSPEFRDLQVKFWGCPEGHSFRGLYDPPSETVRWIKGVAHCMKPGCGRTSADAAVPGA